MSPLIFDWKAMTEWSLEQCRIIFIKDVGKISDVYLECLILTVIPSIRLPCLRHFPCLPWNILSVPYNIRRQICK